MPTQAEHALTLFNTEGEAAMLRYVIDQQMSAVERPETTFLLPDNSEVARRKEDRSYVFIWPGARISRREQSKAIFAWPDCESVIRVMLLGIQTRITPAGAQKPSRGDDPLVDPAEAARLCPELTQQAKNEMDALDPSDALWEEIDALVEDTAARLEKRLTPASLNALEQISRERREKAISEKAAAMLAGRQDEGR